MTKNLENTSIERKKFLLVEGISDKIFFEYYLKHINIKDIQVIQYKEKDHLKKFLIERLIPLNDNFIDLELLIIQMDYDDGKNLKLVEKALNDISYPCPEKEFTIINHKSLKIGFISTPFEDKTNQKKELESLCLELIHDDKEKAQHQQILKLAKQYIKDVNVLHPSSTMHKIDKSILYSYLSVFSKSSGKENNFIASWWSNAIERDCFDFNKPYMSKYKNFFEKI